MNLERRNRQVLPITVHLTANWRSRNTVGSNACSAQPATSEGGLVLSSGPQKVQRFGQVARFRPETKEQYVKYHAEVWPEVLERIQKCNIRNYSIFSRDDQLFAYFEYTGEDFEEDMRKMAADPPTQEGWKLVKPMLVIHSDGECWTNMDEIFHTD